MQDKIEQAVDEFLDGDKSDYMTIWKRLAIELEVNEDNAFAQAGRVLRAVPEMRSMSPMFIAIQHPVACFVPTMVKRGRLPSRLVELSEEEVAERIEGYRRELDAGQD